MTCLEYFERFAALALYYASYVPFLECALFEHLGVGQCVMSLMCCSVLQQNEAPLRCVP